MALYLSRTDVEQICQSVDIEAAMQDVLISVYQGKAGRMVRQELVPGVMPGVLGIMPAYSAGNSKAFTAKVVCVMPDNPKKGLPAHQGVAMLFNGETGELVGFAEAGAVTEARTAAMAALATRTLARPENGLRSLIVGAGHQALPHLLALSRLPNIAQHCVWARQPSAAQALADEVARKGRHLEIEVDLEQAVRSADIVTLVTSAAHPIVDAGWFKKGCHINAMGSSTPRVKEFGEDLIERCAVFTDDRESVLSLAGEFAYRPEPGELTELGEVLSGNSPGRTRHGDVTLFKSVGTAVQDLALLVPMVAIAERDAFGQVLEL